MADNNKYYTIKKQTKNRLVEEYHTLIILSRQLSVPIQTVSNMFNFAFVRRKTADKVCELLDGDIDDLFDEYDTTMVNNDVTYQELSRQILDGMKLAISKRLGTMHTQSYINEIINIVDEIIVEACYLGIELVRHKDEKEIDEAIEKRRKK